MAGDAAEDSGKKDEKSGNQEYDEAGARRAEELPEMKRADVRSRQRYNWREPRGRDCYYFTHNPFLLYASQYFFIFNFNISNISRLICSAV